MISSFQGKFRFLSNFYPAEVELDGITFPTVEHAYQAAKTSDVTQRIRIKALPKPGQAKRAGRSIKLRLNWEDMKLRQMRELLMQKFSKEPLHSMLLETYPEELVEGNEWGDTFWGQCPLGVGENWLGKLLMDIREQLRNASAYTASVSGP